MHVNKTKFERNVSIEYYHVTSIGETKRTSQRGLLSNVSATVFLLLYLKHPEIL